MISRFVRVRTAIVERAALRRACIDVISRMTWRRGAARSTYLVSIRGHGCACAFSGFRRCLALLAIGAVDVPHEHDDADQQHGVGDVEDPREEFSRSAG